MAYNPSSIVNLSPKARRSLPVFSLQPHLDDTLRIRRLRPDPLDLQTRRIEQIPPLLLATFHRAQERHHRDVPLRADETHPSIRQDELVEEDLAVAGFHGVSELGEDELAFEVGPVVEDVAEVVCSGTW